MDFNFDTSTISNVLTLDPTGLTPGYLTVLGTAGMVIPSGNTASRTNNTAILRFNTDTSMFEYFNGASWGTIQVNNAALTGFSNLNGTGFITQTGAGTFAERTINGTAGSIVVTNNSGVNGNPTISLATTGTAGVYASVTTDSFGRVISGSNTQDWSTIVNTPTTVSGYGITNAILNSGNVLSMQAGTIATRPPASMAGNMYISTDTMAQYYDTGTTWVLVTPAMSGDLTTIAGSTVATLASINSNVGSFGSATQIPVLTVNAKGLITSVTTTAISSSIAVSGGDFSLSGNTGTTITNGILATVNNNVGTYGDASRTVQLTVNGKGLVTAVANVLIPNSVTLTGDASGSGTTSSSTTVTLATVNSNVGTFGSNSAVGTFTVNGKGLITSASNLTITPEAIGAINVNKLGVANGIATLDSSGLLTSSQIPSALVGALVYQGVWNATTNTPSIITGSSTTGNKGQYYKVSVAGTTTVDGKSQWNVGDIIVSDGTTWDKIDGLTTEVTSVFGRVGPITASLASADFANQGTSVTVLHGNAAGNPTWGAVSLTTDVTGVLQAAQTPAFTGDVTKTAGSLVQTLASVNGNVGIYGSATQSAQITVNAKGLVTAVTNITIPNTIGLTGDATASVITGSTAPITLATVNSNVGTFGSLTSVPVLTVNAKGLVTAVSTLTIPTAITIAGDVTGTGAVGGTTTVALATVNNNVGTFGSNTTVPVITVNGKGLVTNVSTSTISSAIQLVGDVTGSGATGSNLTVTLGTVNSNIGMYGSNNSVGTFTVNAKGLVTSAGNVSITPYSIGAVSNAGLTPSIQSGLFASMPVAGIAGRLYVTSDTNMIHRDNGSSWVRISEAGLLYSENAISPIANTVTGNNAVAIGSNNLATGANSLATGYGASSANYGAAVHANGSFANVGDAQTGKYVLRNTTTTAASTEVFLDGSASRIVLQNNSSIAYSALIVAQRTDITGYHGAWKIEGLVQRDATASTTTLIGTRSRTTLTAPTGWSADVFADATNGALTFKVTGAAAQTIRWVVTVITSEVSN
jgi:hypothetical protein